MKKIEFQEKNGVCIITPHGEMTFFYLEELDEFIKDKINHDVSKFVYDLSDVKWIDSMGLGLVAMTVKNALLNHTRVCIVKPNENIIDLFRLSSLIDLVRVYDTVDEAVKFLK